MTSWDKVAEHRSAWRSKASVLGREPGWSYWLLQGKVPSNWSWCSQELQGLQGLSVETQQTGFVVKSGRGTYTTM